MKGAVVWLLLACAAAGAAAQYPDRAVRCIVPQAPGSATDTVARILAAEMSKALGQIVIVENRPGGALTNGIDAVAKLPYDISARELIAYAQKNPGKLSNAFSSNGSPRHVQVMWESLNSIAPHARTGKVRALALSGARRSPGFPDLPTIAEAGYAEFVMLNWYGILAPAGTRPEGR